MIKKISCMLVLAVAIILTGAQNQAAAEAVYVGNYDDGSNVYLLTHTIVIKSVRPYSFNCRVRAGYDYLDYYFYPVNGSPYYKNSEGYRGFANPEQSPVAWNIYRYVVNHW